jgi:hypothetical protein
MVALYRLTPGKATPVWRALKSEGIEVSMSTVTRMWLDGQRNYSVEPIRDQLRREGLWADDPTDKLAARLVVSEPMKVRKGRRIRRAVVLKLGDEERERIQAEQARLAVAQAKVDAERADLKAEREALEPYREAAERVVVDAVKERSREALVARSAVNVAMGQLGNLGLVGPAMNELARSIGQKIGQLAASGQVTVADGLRLLDRYAQTTWRIQQMAHKAMTMMRLHLGEPGEIVQMVAPVGADGVTDDDLNALIEELGVEGLQQAIADLAAGRGTELATKLLNLQWQRQEGVTGRPEIH